MHEIAYSHGGKFGTVDLATAFSKLAKGQFPRYSKNNINVNDDANDLCMDLVALIMPLMRYCKAREIASILWALAKINYKVSEFFGYRW